MAVSFVRPSTHWMTAANFGDIWRTTDGGKSFTPATDGIAEASAAVTAAVRQCPRIEDVILTGNSRLWRTNNFFGAATPSWAANAAATTATIRGIAFASSDATCNTYAFGTETGQLRLTRNGGTTWADLDPGKNIPARGVNSLVFDPTDPNTAYVALSGFDDATPGRQGHVFKTTNALAASPVWANVSPAADLPHNVIAIDPANASVVYVGTDAALWRSTNAGASWQRMGPETGMPNVPVFDLKVHPATGRTFAFTFGRGAYLLTANGAPTLVAGIRSPANGATYISGGLVPGSWAQVQGVNLSGVTRTWSDSDFLGLGDKLPLKLSSVEVKVNSISAPVYYISPTLVGFQVPNGILPGPPGDVLVEGTVGVQVFRDGVASNTLGTVATSSSPGIFPIIANGKNYPVGIFLDGKLTGDPANGVAFRKGRPGESVQLFVTGLFRTTSGALVNFQTYNDVTVKIGDITIPADAAALVAPGDFQINFTVPQQFEALPEGDYPISVQLNGPIGTSSQGQAADDEFGV